MLFHSQYNPESAVYHDIISYHIQAPCDPSLLKEALRMLANNHAILQTAFDLHTYSEPLQLVRRSVEIPLQVDDLRSYSETDQEPLLAFWLDQDKAQPFDWRVAPLLRFHVHLRSATSFQLSLSFHHAILDGWSVATLLTELFKLYQSLLGQTHVEAITPPTLQFRDFVALERELLEGGETQQYWMQKLDDRTSMQLPRWNIDRAVDETNSVHVQPVSISQELSLRLKKLAREIAVPVKSVLLAAHLHVLRTLFGQTDVLTGLVTNGRPETTDGERVLGLFLNTLPFRLNVAAGSWIDLVRATFAAECELLPYRWYPLAEIQRQQGGQSLFETIFNFLHFHVYQDVLSPEKATSQQNLKIIGRAGFEKTNFVLAANFSLDPVTSQIHLALRCDTTQLCHDQIEAIASYYATALHCMVQTPTEHYETQSLLSAYEYQQILAEWNTTQAEYPAEQGVHTLFEEQAERTPDRVALVFADGQLTYTALNHCANQLAYRLHTLGIGPDSLVGLCMERSIEMMIGLLGVLKSGGAYIPLDPSYPAARLAYMMDNSQLAVLLTQPSLVTELPPQHAQVLCLSGDASDPVLRDQSTTNPQWPTMVEQLAYVIYTSGSTGQPKGTAITHRAVNKFLHSIDRKSVV